MNYRPDAELVTPYQRAQQVWDDRMGSARRQAYSWRLAAFVSLGVAALMGAGLIYQSSKAEVVPYIVEVDEVGKVRLVGTPRTQEWTPSSTVERYFLEQWLRDVRTLSSDRDVVRSNWLRAYAGVTDTGKVQLDGHAEEAKPFESLGEETRRIEVRSANQVSDASWRIEWREDVFDKSGALSRTETYVGVLKLVRRQPKTQAELEVNPIGLYVDHISWSKQLEGGTR